MENNIITLRLETETFEVKSISAAWNKIRELRDERGIYIEGLVLEVILPESIVTDRIPAKILFKANKNGKIEFKDLAKVKAAEERKAAKAAAAKTVTEKVTEEVTEE